MCRFLDYGLSFTRARDALLLADRAEQEKDSQRTKTEKVQAFLCSEVIQGWVEFDKGCLPFKKYISKTIFFPKKKGWP